MKIKDALLNEIDNIQEEHLYEIYHYIFDLKLQLAHPEVFEDKGPNPNLDIDFRYNCEKAEQNAIKRSLLYKASNICNNPKSKAAEIYQAILKLKEKGINQEEITAATRLNSCELGRILFENNK